LAAKLKTFISLALILHGPNLRLTMPVDASWCSVQGEYKSAGGASTTTRIQNLSGAKCGRRKDQHEDANTEEN
jgi:hypothetical protein